MKERSIFGLKNILLTMCLALVFAMGLSQTVHAETLTGNVRIVGEMKPGSTLTVAIDGCNNTGELSYRWVFDNGAVDIKYERYFQSYYNLWEEDFGHFLRVEVTSNRQTGTLKSSDFMLVQGGSFGSGTGGGSTAAPSERPAAPSVWAVTGDGKVTLYWNSVSGATEYVIYHHNAVNNSLDKMYGKTSENSFCVEGLTNGTPVSLLVRARNAAGLSAWAPDQAIVVTPGTTTSTTPTPAPTATPTPTPTPAPTPTPTPITFEKQPEDVVASEREWIMFSVTVSGGQNPTYLWQSSLDGKNWTNLTENASYSSGVNFPVSASDDGKLYRCEVTSRGIKYYSNTAKLTIKKEMKITQQPVSLTAKVGDKVTFSVQATGTGLTYQWQYRNAGVTTWTKSTLTSAKTANMSFTAEAKYENREYQCVITDASGKSVTTNVATLKFATAIVTQPASLTAAIDDKVSFQVKAVGEGLTYQWQYRNAGATDWTDSTLASAKTAKMSVSVIAKCDNREYRCIITDAAGKKVTSNVAVLKLATAIITQPVSTTAAIDGTATFQVKAVGDGLTYQWQYRNAGATSWSKSTLSSAQTAKLTVSVSAKCDNREYRCVVTDAAGKKVTSNVAVLKLATAIVTQPVSTTAAIDAKVYFQVKAVGDGLTYQWQYRNAGATTWTNSTLTSAKTAKLAVSATAKCDNREYRCVVTDAAGKKVTSNVAVLKLTTAIVTQPVATSAAVGAQASFKVKAVGEGLTYQWQYSKDGVTWTKSTADTAKKATLSVTAKASFNGRLYRCVVTGADGIVVESSAAKLTVK